MVLVDFFQPFIHGPVQPLRAAFRAADGKLLSRAGFRSEGTSYGSARPFEPEPTPRAATSRAARRTCRRPAAAR
jgi:hypothetical protein